MFDTIRLGAIEVEIDPGRLLSKGWTEQRSKRVDAEGVASESVCYRLVRAGTSPQFVQYSPASGTLKLETSLPKVIHGENVSLLRSEEVGPTLDELSNRVGDMVGCEVPHCGEWNVRGRVDAVFSWNAGSRVSAYLHAFKGVQLPRHYNQSVDSERTLYWRNHQRVLRMYDKQKETGLDLARGLLRFEAQLNHAKSEFERLMEVETMKAKQVLNWESARAVLQNYLDRLGADLVIADQEKLFEQLRAKCGNAKAIRLMGLISVMGLYSRDELISMGYSRKTLWRNVREINSAGATATNSDSGVLSPLTLPKMYTGDVGFLDA